jgi:8-oxo-dGTP pyrophosphatase MutT (NUDIX family)
MSSAAIYPVDRIELKLVPWSWPFAIQRRAEIDIYFAQQRRHNPTLWNGRLLLSRELLLKEGTLGGMLFETDYASLLAGLEWGAIGESVKVCFGVAALLAADGAFIVGHMAAHTRNAGKVLFPSGSLDPDDVSNGKVDVYSNVLRELEEETGLTGKDFDAEPGWNVALTGPHIPIVKVMRAKHPAERLRKRIQANLAGQTQPEFSDIQIVRGRSDLNSRMPVWMHAFFAHVWS